MYNTQTMKLAKTINVGSIVESVSFGSDKDIVIADADKTVQIYTMDMDKFTYRTRYDDFLKIRSVSISPNGKFLAIKYSKDTHKLILQPITMCDRPEKEMLAILFLINMDKSVKLNRSSWVYKTFMQLDKEERNRIMEQHPHVGTIIENSVDDLSSYGVCPIL